MANDEAGALTKLYIGQTRRGISRRDDHNAKRKSLLFDSGIVQKTDGKYYLIKVISFRTPSGASDFVMGGSTNVWVEWRDEDGKTKDEFFGCNQSKSAWYHMRLTVYEIAKFWGKSS